MRPSSCPYPDPIDAAPPQPRRAATPERAASAPLALRLADAPQAVHRDRVVGEGARIVQEGVQELVVAGRGDPEVLPYGPLLGAGTGPGRALDGEDGAVRSESGRSSAHTAHRQRPASTRMNSHRIARTRAARYRHGPLRHRPGPADPRPARAGSSGRGAHRARSLLDASTSISAFAASFAIRLSTTAGLPSGATALPMFCLTLALTFAHDVLPNG